LMERHPAAPIDPATVDTAAPGFSRLRACPVCSLVSFVGQLSDPPHAFAAATPAFVRSRLIVFSKLPLLTKPATCRKASPAMS